MPNDYKPIGPRQIDGVSPPTSLLQLMAEAIAETHLYDDLEHKERSKPDPDRFLVVHLSLCRLESAERWKRLKDECQARRMVPPATQTPPNNPRTARRKAAPQVDG